VFKRRFIGATEGKYTGFSNRVDAMSRAMLGGAAPYGTTMY
jgi:hypothetical protein